MQENWIKRTFKGDRVIWTLVAVFMIYSLLAVYSSSAGVAFMKYGGNNTYFLRSQFIMLVLSLVIIVVVHHLPYRIYSSLAGLGLLLSVVLLILTFLIGSRVNEATRWIEIPGTGFRLQTSDVAKVALVVYLARVLSRFQNELKDFMLVSKYMMFPVAVICALIMPENLSTALMIFGICILIMFIGRVPFRFLLAYIGIGVAGVLLFAVLLLLFQRTTKLRYGRTGLKIIFPAMLTPMTHISRTSQDSHFHRRFIWQGARKKHPANMLPQSNSDFILPLL